jgi:hypothetical protein
VGRTRSNAAGVPQDDGDAEAEEESVAYSPEVGADRVDRDGAHNGASGDGAGPDIAGQRTDSTSHSRAELNARFPDIL